MNEVKKFSVGSIEPNINSCPKFESDIKDFEIQWLKAANEELKEKIQWQPIETAPKDGTWILVYKPFNLYGFDDSKWFVDKYIVRWADECWNISMEDKVAYPTHWMPLPKPPTQ